MMIIVRMLPLGSKEELWVRLAESVPRLRVQGATPLFLSQHEEHDHVSIVFDADSFDAMVPVFCEQLASCGPIRRTQTSPLLRPVFFPVPKERPDELFRYRLALKVRTRQLRDVYNQLSVLNYPKEVFPTYQAFSFGSEDILVSILAPNRTVVESVVRDQISRFDGVLETELTFVNRNLRVASGEQWRRYREAHYLTPVLETADVEFDWLDAAMSGAFVDEF